MKQVTMLGGLRELLGSSKAETKSRPKKPVEAAEVKKELETAAELEVAKEETAEVASAIKEVDPKAVKVTKETTEASPKVVEVTKKETAEVASAIKEVNPKAVKVAKETTEASPKVVEVTKKTTEASPKAVEVVETAKAAGQEMTAPKAEALTKPVKAKQSEAKLGGDLAPAVPTAPKTERPLRALIKELEAKTDKLDEEVASLREEDSSLREEIAKLWRRVDLLEQMLQLHARWKH